MKKMKGTIKKESHLHKKTDALGREERKRVKKKRKEKKKYLKNDKKLMEIQPPFRS